MPDKGKQKASSGAGGGDTYKGSSQQSIRDIFKVITPEAYLSKINDELGERGEVKTANGNAHAEKKTSTTSTTPRIELKDGSSARPIPPQVMKYLRANNLSVISTSVLDGRRTEIGCAVPSPRPSNLTPGAAVSSVASSSSSNSSSSSSSSAATSVSSSSSSSSSAATSASQSTLGGLTRADAVFSPPPPRFRVGKGKAPQRRFITVDEQIDALKTAATFGGRMRPADIAAVFQVSTPTVYKWLTDAKKNAVIFRAGLAAGEKFHNNRFLDWYKGRLNNRRGASNLKRSKALRTYKDSEGDNTMSIILQLRVLGYRVTRRLAVSIMSAVSESNRHFTDAWAGKFLRDRGLTSRRVTGKVHVAPLTSAEVQERVNKRFLQRIAFAAREFNIPDALILNWDQTSAGFHPSALATTYDARGARRVPSVKVDDKLSCTMLLTIALNGNILPAQVVFRGGPRCVPKTTFDNLVYDTSSSGWSDDNTMRRFIKDIVIPYTERVRQDDQLPPYTHDDSKSCRALLVFDCWARHKDEGFRKFLSDHDFRFVFVPAGMTATLQPLDVGVNKPVKDRMKEFREAQVRQTLAEKLKDPAVADSAAVAAVMKAVYAGIPELRELVAASASHALEAVTTEEVKMAFTSATWDKIRDAEFLAQLDAAADKVTADELGNLPSSSSSTDIAKSVKPPEGVTVDQMASWAAEAQIAEDDAPTDGSDNDECNNEDDETDHAYGDDGNIANERGGADPRRRGPKKKPTVSEGDLASARAGAEAALSIYNAQKKSETEEKKQQKEQKLMAEKVAKAKAKEDKKRDRESKKQANKKRKKNKVENGEKASEGAQNAPTHGVGLKGRRRLALDYAKFNTSGNNQ